MITKPSDKYGASVPGGSTVRKDYLLAAGGLLLVFHALIFLRFFPNDNQALGHDYAYLFPALLDGFFWYRANGLLEIPWFTPSFCGGSLVYSNVVRGFYTVPQFLTFLVDPLTAVRLTLVLFALLGLAGFYRLLRSPFGLSPQIALCGAGFFLFNGFFSHRMLIGHLDFCHFMLLPLIAWLLLTPLAANRRAAVLQGLTGCLLAGLLLVVIVQSNFVTLILPAMVAILVIGLLHGLIHGQTAVFIWRLGITCLAGVLLSLSRLIATIDTLAAFPRSAYNLPGADSLLDAAGLMLRAIFISPAFDSDRFDALTNTQWYLDRHEWEFSITPVPLIILLFGLIVLMKRLRKDTARPIPAPGRFLHLTAIILLLLLPVGLNCYTPGWNQFLKQLPVIGSSSTLIRWAIIYIPVVILLAALVLDRIIPRGRLQSAAAAVCLGAVILLNLAADRTYYHAQGYRAEPVQQAYHDVRAGSWTPEIRFVMVYRDGNGQILTPGHRNDTITLGGSQLFCYEALFGYRLEAFPFGDLHPGPVTAETNGRLNLKNPACYVWPGENNCRPGDHFSVAARAAANSFSRYRPFDFKLPLRQTIANWLNGITLVATLGFLLIRGFSRIHRKLS